MASSGLVRVGVPTLALLGILVGLIFMPVFGWVIGVAPSAPAAAIPGIGGGNVQISGSWAAPASMWSKTSDFGPRWGRTHEGTDFSEGPCGIPIYAASSGTVVLAGEFGGYGNAVRIDHGGGVETLYGHMPWDGRLVKQGDTVTVGQVIGVQGETGNSFGCHLHFEVWLNGYKTDPIPFLAERGIK